MSSEGRKMPGEADVAELLAEERLVVAVLRQVLIDSASRRQEIRAEAHRFLADPAAVGFWVDLAGIESDAVLRYVRRHLAARTNISVEVDP